MQTKHGEIALAARPQAEDGAEAAEYFPSHRLRGEGAQLRGITVTAHLIGQSEAQTWLSALSP